MLCNRYPIITLFPLVRTKSQCLTYYPQATPSAVLRACAFAHTCLTYTFQYRVSLLCKVLPKTHYVQFNFSIIYADSVVRMLCGVNYNPDEG